MHLLHLLLMSHIFPVTVKDDLGRSGCTQQARQLCTDGISDVLRFKENDRVINVCTSADVNSISCIAAAAGRLQ